MSDDSDSSFEIPVDKKSKVKKTIRPKKKQKKIDHEKENVCFKSKKPPCNILDYYRHSEMGLYCQKYRKPLKDSVINYCKAFKLTKVESPFDRRVTFLIWHPTNPRLLAVASHWGDVILYNYEQDLDSASLINGIGPGGSIQGMKFDMINPVLIYTASMEGKFMVMNFETKKAKPFLETHDINRWYISVDVNPVNNLMVAGDTKGSLSILTLQGEIVLDQIQVHQKGFKVSHAEFSKREPWLLCTSSIDSTMKLWDVRNLRKDTSSKPVPLHVIHHTKPINAAYFSLTDGCRLLTTDQFDKMYIYKAPLWNLETCISHPHRQFQHLTPIKAYWHPLEDIVFVGRYPHEDFPGYHENELRTIDFFDADTGELLYQHFAPGFNGIMPLNRFNHLGDTLASGFGTRFLIWKPNFKNLERLSKKQDHLDRKERKRANHHTKDDNGDDDEDDGDDGNDDDEIDWKAFLKKQSQEKAPQKKKIRTESKIQTKTCTKKKGRK